MSAYEESSVESLRRVEDFMVNQMKVDRVVFQNELIEEFKRAIPHGNRFDSFNHKLKVYCTSGFMPDSYFIRMDFNFCYVSGSGDTRVMTVHCTFSPSQIEDHYPNVKQMVLGQFLSYFHSAASVL